MNRKCWSWALRMIRETNWSGWKCSQIKLGSCTPTISALSFEKSTWGPILLCLWQSCERMFPGLVFWTGNSRFRCATLVAIYQAEDRNTYSFIGGKYKTMPMPGCQSLWIWIWISIFHSTPSTPWLRRARIKNTNGIIGTFCFQFQKDKTLNLSLSSNLFLASHWFVSTLPFKILRHFSNNNSGIRLKLSNARNTLIANSRISTSTDSLIQQIKTNSNGQNSLTFQ